MTNIPMYNVKCDDCKKTIKQSTDVRESYAGGQCQDCAINARRNN